MPTSECKRVISIGLDTKDHETLVLLKKRDLPSSRQIQVNINYALSLLNGKAERTVNSVEFCGRKIEVLIFETGQQEKIVIGDAFIAWMKPNEPIREFAPFTYFVDPTLDNNGNIKYIIR